MEIRNTPPLVEYSHSFHATYLQDLMLANYTVDQLRPEIDPAHFEEYLLSECTFGHDHDFGTFSIRGPMGDRHIAIMAALMKEFNLTADDLVDKKVFDVGCWSGGVSLLSRAMGAKVYAHDIKYEHTYPLVLLQDAFSISDLQISSEDVYGSYSFEDESQADILFCFGVIYHTTSPLEFLYDLRCNMNDNAVLYLESSTANRSGLLCEYRGLDSGRESGPNYFVPTTECLVKWLSDTSFEPVLATNHGQRSLVKAIAKE